MTLIQLHGSITLQYGADIINNTFLAIWNLTSYILIITRLLLTSDDDECFESFLDVFELIWSTLLPLRIATKFALNLCTLL